jgi:natural product precursor
MKKLKFENKLSLKKETIVQLNNGQMSQLAGGGTILTTWVNCGSANPGTAIGVTCVSAGVTCGCPSNSLHSECSC